MAFVDALMRELEGIPAYLDESKNLVGDITTLKKAQALTIGAKIQNLKTVGMHDATRLKKSIALVGWSESDNTRLSALLDEAVDKSMGLKTVRRCSQRCATWELYPTDGDWRVLGDTLC